MCTYGKCSGQDMGLFGGSLPGALIPSSYEPAAY